MNTDSSSDSASVDGQNEPVAGTDAAPAESVEATPAADAPAAPTPRPSAPRPGVPRPGAFKPGPSPVPSAPTATPATSASDAEPWGQVDDEGNVSVREADGWRVIGQYPDGTPAEALAYFERKFADLAAEVALLESRHRGGGTSASDLRSAVAKTRGRVVDAAAVGDLAALGARLDALDSTLASASAEEAQAARAAADEAVVFRTTIVEKMEAIAARKPESIQWKQTTVEVTDLFTQWQTHQSEGPRLPKAVGQQLWKRFRDARSIVDRHRRDFYSSLDEQHRSARADKTRLIERAEALAPKGEDGIADYRALLDQWKQSGRAGKKSDDALWERFKAAGDALYAARAEREQADAVESEGKIEIKRGLLAEAAAIPAENDAAKARSLLTSIQRKWDDVGRIWPRDAERRLDDELRKIEQGVRSREDADWKNNNPETKARQNDMTQQLHDAIAKLEADLATAEKSGNKGAIAQATEALSARKAWLKALGG